jgi:hypothetical protein
MPGRAHFNQQWRYDSSESRTRHACSACNQLVRKVSRTVDAENEQEAGVRTCINDDGSAFFPATSGSTDVAAADSTPRAVGPGEDIVLRQDAGCHVRQKLLRN